MEFDIFASPSLIKRENTLGTLKNLPNMQRIFFRYSVYDPLLSRLPFASKSSYWYSTLNLISQIPLLKIFWGTSDDSGKKVSNVKQCPLYCSLIITKKLLAYWEKKQIPNSNLRGLVIWRYTRMGELQHFNKTFLSFLKKIPWVVPWEPPPPPHTVGDG